ncbi:protein kinase domain-containing protein [Amycolatopsis sp. lyj-90]|uniref:serine/threonine-protein kinase n=1 Tax=Amycolatopsis sp. lyj-90 TaxID=2789285 RepID=UPI00397A57DB
MAPEASPGRLIGDRYRLVEVITAGGFGRIWQARDETLRVDVALKETWRSRPVSDHEWADLLTRAQREARNAAQLRDHPNIVTVYDAVIEDGIPWTVMRLVTGKALQDLRADGPLIATEVVHIAKSLLGALSAVHAAGIVHRDVKPSNVMVTASGEVLLIDFGIAVHQDDTRTLNGLIIGSPGYLAPERVRGDRGGAPSDLFSLGATLYHAVEGISPFHRDTPEDSAAAVLYHQPLLPQCETGLALLIMRLLEKDPAKRPLTSEALALLDATPAKVPRGGEQPDVTPLVSKLATAAQPFKVGDRFRGTVTKTAAFGAFVSLTPGRQGLVHISKLGNGKRVRYVEDEVKVGDELHVEIAEIKRGKVGLVVVTEEPPPGR